MNRYVVRVRVTPRPGLLDPQGKAIHHALGNLGYEGVQDVRVGKSIELFVDAPDEESARTSAAAMSDQLLANPVTEDVEITVEHAQ